jgi:KipI family sensor histidine kinase inhibitor
MNALRVTAAGDAVLVAELDDRIDAAVNDRAVGLADALRASPLPGVLDIVPTFRSVAVYFDPLATDASVVAAAIRIAARRPPQAVVRSHRLVEIPVCYDDEFAPDLGDVAQFAGAAPASIVDLHLSREYRVFMLGFVPGFAYLGTVDASIAAPRRQTPRTAVPAGSVAIAGELTGVYPVQTPGGWNIVGRTPLRMLALDRAETSLLRAGDTVRFQRIDRAEFDRLARHARP